MSPPVDNLICSSHYRG